MFDAIPDVMRYERAPFKDIAAVRHAVPFSEVPYAIRKTPELTSVEVTFTALEQTLKMEMARRNYTRLVIDSLTALQDFCMKGVDEVGGAQTFLRFLSDLRVTTVLTVESPIEESETAERLLARGEVRLSRWEVDDRTIQAIGVEKFRGSAHDIRRHPYRIGPVGLDIDLETTVSRDPAGTGSARSEQAEERARNRPASSLPDVVALIAAVRDLVEVGVDVSSAQAEVDRAAAATESGRTAAAGRHLLRARGIVSQLALEWERTRESPQPPAPPAAFRSAEPKLEASATTAAIPPPAPKLPAWLQETTAVPAEPAPATGTSARGPAVAPPPAPTKPRSFSLPPVTLRRTASRPPLPSAPGGPPGLVALPRGASSPESPLAGTAAGPAPLSVGLLLVTPSVTPHEAGAPDGMTARAPVAPPATRIENPTPAAPSPVGGLGHEPGPIESGRAARRARRRGTSRKAFAGAAGGFAAAPVTPTTGRVPGGDGAVRDGPIPESPVHGPDVAALVPVPVSRSLPRTVRSRRRPRTPPTFRTPARQGRPRLERRLRMPLPSSFPGPRGLRGRSRADPRAERPIGRFARPHRHPAGGRRPRGGERMMETAPRVSTGIVGLDRMLGGGLIAGRPYLVTGATGSGKTLLGLSFLMEGIRRGEDVLLVAVDEPPSEILENVRSFGWDLSKIRTLDANPGQRAIKRLGDVQEIRALADLRSMAEISTEGKKGVDEDVSLQSIHLKLRQQMATGHFTRVLLDSITSIHRFALKMSKDPQAERTEIQSLLRFLSERETTALVTASPGTPVRSPPRRSLTRGEIRLSRRWDGDRSVSQIRVVRMRGSAHDPGSRPFTIGAQGVIVG